MILWYGFDIRSRISISLTDCSTLFVSISGIGMKSISCSELWVSSSTSFICVMFTGGGTHSTLCTPHSNTIAKVPAPINVKLPDGAVVEGQSWRTTPYDVASGIRSASSG